MCECVERSLLIQACQPARQPTPQCHVTVILTHACISVPFPQNGYPSRRRSLVDDARFETIVVKQTKQSVLEEAREKANGKLQFLFSRTCLPRIFRTLHSHGIDFRILFSRFCFDMLVLCLCR